MTDPAPPQYNWQTIVQFSLINFPTEPLLSYSAIIVILFLNWDLVNNRTRMLQMTFTLQKKHLPPQLSSICLVLEKIQPRPPAYWLGEILETVPRPNFRPAKR
jgi:hypothetical protein